MPHKQSKQNSLWASFLNRLQSIHTSLPNVSPFLETKHSRGLKLFIHGNVVTIRTGRSSYPKQPPSNH